MGRKPKDTVQIKVRVTPQCREWWESLARESGNVWGEDGVTVSPLIELIAGDPTIASAVRAMVLERSKK